jgi:hypothetical protein
VAGRRRSAVSANSADASAAPRGVAAMAWADRGNLISGMHAPFRSTYRRGERRHGSQWRRSTGSKTGEALADGACIVPRGDGGSTATVTRWRVDHAQQTCRATARSRPMVRRPARRRRRPLLHCSPRAGCRSRRFVRALALWPLGLARHAARHQFENATAAGVSALVRDLWPQWAPSVSVWSWGGWARRGSTRWEAATTGRRSPANSALRTGQVIGSQSAGRIFHFPLSPPGNRREHGHVSDLTDDHSTLAGPADPRAI